MPEIGLPELLIILVVVLVLFGPGRLAGIGGALGQAIREFRQGVGAEAENKPPTSTASDPHYQESIN